MAPKQIDTLAELIATQLPSLILERTDSRLSQPIGTSYSLMRRTHESFLWVICVQWVLSSDSPKANKKGAEPESPAPCSPFDLQIRALLSSLVKHYFSPEQNRRGAR